MALALTAFHIALIVIAAGLFVGAAVSDALSYRVPTYMCVLLLLLFPLFVGTAPHAFDWHQHLAVFGLVALSGYAMFLGNLASSGDVKLLSVAGLWAGPHLIAVLVIVTAIAAGFVSILMAILAHRRAPSIEEESVTLVKPPIPYGVAIAIGGLATLAMIAQPILLPG